MTMTHRITAEPQAGWRILVPLDDTLQAHRALAYASELARATNGHVRLIRAGAAEAESGSNSLGANAERLRQAGLSVEWTVVDASDAAPLIVDTASAWQADVIILATRKWSALDRWLNGSVTDAVVSAAAVPVLVVPPDWDRPFANEQPARILVPLDGSRLAEQALGPVLRLGSVGPVHIVLLRAIEHEDVESTGAQEYLSDTGSQLDSERGPGQVSTRLVPGPAVAAILDTARTLSVDMIAMSTRGRSGVVRTLLGSTATAVLQQSGVPLLLLGPRALVQPTAQIRIRAPVRTVDHDAVGEVHRLVVDLEQQAIVSVVVLGRDPLARDVLVPVDFVESVSDGQLELRLTRPQFDSLPDFAWNDFLTPPPTWTSFVPTIDGPTLVPVVQRKLIGAGQQDITPGTRVVALDGDLGTVDRLDVDRQGRLDAFWVRADGMFASDMRIPAEWVQAGAGEEGNLHVAARRADVEAYLGYESRVRLRPSGP